MLENPRLASFIHISNNSAIGLTPSCPKTGESPVLHLLLRSEAVWVERLSSCSKKDGKLGMDCLTKWKLILDTVCEVGKTKDTRLRIKCTTHGDGGGMHLLTCYL